MTLRYSETHFGRTSNQKTTHLLGSCTSFGYGACPWRRTLRGSSKSGRQCWSLFPASLVSFVHCKGNLCVSEPGTCYRGRRMSPDRGLDSLWDRHPCTWGLLHKTLKWLTVLPDLVHSCPVPVWKLRWRKGCLSAENHLCPRPWSRSEISVHNVFKVQTVLFS